MPAITLEANGRHRCRAPPAACGRQETAVVQSGRATKTAATSDLVDGRPILRVDLTEHSFAGPERVESAVARPQRLPAAPLVPVLAAVIGGLVLDHYFAPDLWLALPLLAVAAVLGRRPYRHVAVWFLAGVAAAGYHRFYLHVDERHDIAALVAHNPTLTGLEKVRLRGVVAETPSVRLPEWAPSWKRDGGRYTLLAVEVTAYQSGDGWRPAKGCVHVRVNGAARHVGLGDEVRVLGSFTQPDGPRNAGEFDYADYLRQRRVRGVVYGDDPSAVVVLREASPWSWGRNRDSLRLAASERFHALLSPAAAVLADALILGKQDTLTTGDIAPFLESGTLHLLIVSGAHLVMMAGFAWLAGLAIGLTPARQAASVIALCAAYAYFTGGNPPVVRAAIAMTVVLAEYPLRRRSRPLNNLAVAALIVLAVNPTDFFRNGPQLSFLAMMGLVALVPARRGFWPRFRTAGVVATETAAEERPLLARAVSAAGRAVEASVWVWMLTFPLLWARFHLISPVSILLSPLLGLPVAAALVLGPLMLVIDGIAGGLSAPFAWLLDGLLRWTREAADAADLPGLGHWFAPAPPSGWTLGFYLLLLLPWLRSRQPPGRWYGPLLAAMLVAGVVLARWPTRPAGPQFHQLAIGHGLCTVLRLPDGSTVLYDCGSLSGPTIARRSVAPWLWHHGIRRIDALFLSHADIDHFGGVADLLARFPISVVYVSGPTAESKQEEMVELFRRLKEARIPVQTVSAADRLVIGGDTFEVWQPPPLDRSILSQTSQRTKTATVRADNIDSLVILWTTCGRRVLLTGDVERDGLARMLSRPRDQIDLLAAPHHGSATSNNRAMADWSRPTIVVSSDTGPESKKRPLDHYRRAGAMVCRTAVDGTVSVDLGARELRLRTFRTEVDRRFP